MITEELRAAWRYHFRNYVRAATIHKGQGNPLPMLAKRALERARDNVSAGKKHYTGALNYMSAVTWQDDARKLAYVNDTKTFGFRFVGNVEPERARFTNHDQIGWLTDPHGYAFKDETGLCWGVVYQLPAKDGCARFVAGYQFGGVDDGPTLDLANIFTSRSARGDDTTAQDHEDARDAARTADRMAQDAADRERDYQAAWQAGSRWNDAKTRIAHTREALLALLKERRTVMWSTDDGKPPLAICTTIVAQVRQFLSEISEARKEMEALKSGQKEPYYWNTYASDLVAAFNDGACI